LKLPGQEEISLLREKNKGEKGQTTIEFLIIFLILLTYLQLVVVPSWETGAGSLRDVRRITGVGLAAEKLAAAIEKIAATPGESSMEITLLLPEDVEMRCDPVSKEIEYGILHPDFSSANCNENSGISSDDCGKSIKLLDKVTDSVDVVFTCNVNFTVSTCFVGTPPAKFGKGSICPDTKATVTISKQLDAGQVKIFVTEVT
jgi:hypothetical protein